MLELKDKSQNCKHVFLKNFFVILVHRPFSKLATFKTSSMSSSTSTSNSKFKKRPGSLFMSLERVIAADQENKFQSRLAQVQELAMATATKCKFTLLEIRFKTLSFQGKHNGLVRKRCIFALQCFKHYLGIKYAQNIDKQKTKYNEVLNSIPIRIKSTNFSL